MKSFIISLFFIFIFFNLNSAEHIHVTKKSSTNSFIRFLNVCKQASERDGSSVDLKIISIELDDANDGYSIIKYEWNIYK
jgi:hypothetical protein